jgi:hypothetical protein
MTRKTPTDFGSHGGRLAHISNEVPIPVQAYARALGRTELFRRFYQVRRLPFPTRFAEELERVENLRDSEQTAALEALNEAIFRNLTKQLFDDARSAASEDAAEGSATPQEQVRELLRHLAQKNPYFALWIVYKNGINEHAIGENWGSYLVEELGADSADEIAFAQAMSELDKLLILFHDRNQALPSLVFERIWFLHSLRGPERMAQTRAVLGMLTAELAACTSA